MRTTARNLKSSLTSTAARVRGATHWLVLVATLLLWPLVGLTQPAITRIALLRTESGLFYTTNGGTITIVGFPNTPGTVMIPDTIDNLPVTGIGTPLFQKPSSLMRDSAPYQGPANIVVPASVLRIDPAAFSSLQALVGITTDPANPVYTSIDGSLYDKDKTQILRYPPGRAGECSIAGGVRTIATGAFSSCRGLRRVILPEGVEEIGPWAFSGCYELRDVQLPEGLRTLGFGAFQGCSSLATIAVPDGITRIEWSTFAGCYSLAQITLPAGLTMIGDGAFSSCWSLLELVIPAGVTAIGPEAFASCGNLRLIQLPAGIQTIDTGAFAGCIALTTFVIPDTVTRIAERAFSGCHRLAQVHIPASVTSIGAGAFSSCRSLTTVEIPATVTDIAGGAFGACYSLTTLAVDPRNPNYSSVDGVLFDKPQSVLIQCPAGRTGALNVPGTVTRIGASAFTGCDNLTAITIPEGVTDIGDHAFDNCGGLATLALPTSILHIGDGAFSYCIGLRDLVIPENVSGSLNDSLFGCHALRHVTLPAGVTNIGSGAFSDCPSLLSISVDPQNPAYSSVYGVLLDRNLTALVHFPKGRAGSFAVPEGVTEIAALAFGGCANLTGISLPNGLTNIGRGAFSDCTSLAGIAIPPTVLQIGDSAFAGCTKLDMVSVPPSVKHLGAYAFGDCTNLSTVTISEGVTSLGSCAFSGCSLLTSVWIPSSLTNMGGTVRGTSLRPMLLVSLLPRPDSTVFAGCSRLREINVDPHNPALYSRDGVLFSHGKDDLSIPGLVNNLNYYPPQLIRYPEGKVGSYSVPSNITSIIPAAFRNCTGLTGVTIPEGVTEIGSDTFNGCANLASVTLPDSLRIIGDQSFQGCTELTDITMPSGVTAIGYGAFGNCTQLTNVVLPEALSGIGSQAFAGCTHLLEVQVPAAVTEIGTDAFRPSPATTSALIPVTDPTGLALSLQAIDVDPQNPAYSSLDGVLFNKDQTVLLQYPGGKLGDYTVPASVTRIEPNAFRNCPGLTSIALPPGITEVQAYAFKNCVNLANVSIPQSVVSLGESAFSGCTALRTILVPGGIANIPWSCFAECTSLSDITLQSGVRWLQPGAFDHCTSLTRISIPDTVTSIDDWAFGSCTNLADFEVSAQNPTFTSQDGVLFNMDRTTMIQFPPGKVGSYAIPEGVKTLGSIGFGWCERLTRISVPASLTSMLERSFGGCPNLTTIDVAAANPTYSSWDGILFDKTGATMIQYPLGRTGDYAVPGGVTRISQAFAGCRGLTRITIPARVTDISEWALSSCPNLTAIEVDPLNPAFAVVDGVLFDKSLTYLLRSPVTLSGSYVIPATVTQVASDAFAYCTGLTALTVPAGVSGFEWWSGAWGCTNLQSVFMRGDAPSYEWIWPEGFMTGTRIYYQSGTEGWGTEFGGLPTALWNPVIVNNGQNLGLNERGFGFNFTGAAGLVIIVEACTDLAHPTWIPVATNTLAAGTATFQDPEWTGYAGQFYRLRTR